jgi:hypothetical protein
LFQFFAIFLIFLDITSFCIAIYLLVTGENSSLFYLFISISLIFTPLVILFFHLRKKNKNVFDNIQIKKDKLINENKSQLKNIYKINNIANYFNTVQSLFPAFKFNLSQTITNEKEFDLSFKKVEVINLISGYINNNPFLIFNTKQRYIGMKTYTASITLQSGINSRNSTPSFNTLTASVRKTFIDYRISPVFALIDTKTIAEKLNFSMPGSTRGLLNMENREFDKKFPSSRNDEVLYRFLFTPLCQEEMVKLIKSGYVSALSYKKTGSINFISSSVLNENLINDYIPPYLFHFDYEFIKESFINDYFSFFRSIYFKLAPFLTIPAYQKFNKIEEKKDLSISFSELGTILHSIKYQGFKNKKADANADMCHLVNSYDDDVVSFDTLTHYSVSGTEYVHVHGHNIAVPYVEMFPLTSSNTINCFRTTNSKIINKYEFCKHGYNKTFILIGKFKDIVFFKLKDEKAKISNDKVEDIVLNIE